MMLHAKIPDATTGNKYSTATQVLEKRKQIYLQPNSCSQPRSGNAQDVTGILTNSWGIPEDPSYISSHTKSNYEQLK